MKVSEVFPGTSAGSEDAFIELQMFEAGQNLVGGHKVDYYTANGALLGSYTIASNVGNGESQRTILIGDTATLGAPDFVVPQLHDALFAGTTTGGAVCFPDASPVDCVSWGSFTGSLPGATGAPVSPSGIPPGSSISRRITPGCATLLEPGDDTDNSSVDFAVTATPTPRNNATVPTETPCTGGNGDTDSPNTTIRKSPPNRTESSVVTYRFKADEANATFECKIDKRPFRRCSSPKKVRGLDEGKHSFKVRAIDAAGNVDTTPAKDRFKVI